MTVVTMAQRRKATTYGKASRKPIITTGGAFAQAAGTSIWDSRGKLQDWDEDGVSIKNQLANAQANDTGSESTDKGKSSPALQSKDHRKTTVNKHKTHSSLAPSVASQGGAVFDVPSSNDDHKTRASSSDAMARKRQKITPQSVDDDLYLVFDDASLQRHVAAEASNDTYTDLKPTSKATAGEYPRSAHARSESQSEIRLSPYVKQHRASAARRPRNQADTAQAAAVHGTKAKREVKPRPGGGNQAPVLKTETPPRQVPKVKNGLPGNVVRPVTPENTPKATLVHRSGGSLGSSSSSTKVLYRPSTPPRRTKTPDGATTPRQRELWNRLLSDDAHTASPSNLDLPGLMLTDKKVERSEEPLTARKVIWGKALEADIKTRPKRIIDTLHPSDQSRIYSEDDEMDESSEDSSSDACSRSLRSEGSAVNDAVTVQTSPSAKSQSRGQALLQQPLSQSSQAIPPLHGVGLKVTYARQRSYLTDHDLDEVAMLSVPVVPEPINRKAANRRGLGEKAPGLQSTNVFDDDDFGAAQDSQGGAMRSIHELREAGGNVRLTSELEAILDDLDEKEPASTTLRCTRLMDLVTKLQEPSRCRLFVDQGMESRLLRHVGFGDDLIDNSLMAAAILQLLVGPTSAPLLAQVSDIGVVDFLIGLLGLDQDLVTASKLRSNNLSKVAQLEYRRLCASLLKSPMWRVGKPSLLSCHALALQCLEYLVRQTREAGSLSEVLSAHAIRRIVVTSLPSSSTPLPSPNAISTLNLELAVSILESCTISNAAEYQESLWEGDTLKRVIGLLPLLASWKEEECATSRTLTLRLYVNLTNNNPGLCEDFSTPAIVDALSRIIMLNFEQLSDHAMKQEKLLMLDHLILSLGSFSNLAESSDLARQLALELRHGDQSYLDVLLEIFMTKSKSAAEVRAPLFTYWTNYTDSYRSTPRKRLARTLP